MKLRNASLAALLLVMIMGAARGVQTLAAPAAAHHYLYVAEPGIRNYRRVRRRRRAGLRHGSRLRLRAAHSIARTSATGAEPENVKGIAASAATGRLYVTTHRAPDGVRPRDRSQAVGSAARRRLRPDVDLARRQDALRAVVRGTALERGRCRDRRRHDRRSSPTPAPTTRSTGPTGGTSTSPG